MKQYKCISVSQAKGLFPGPSQPQLQVEDLETILNKDFAWNMYNAEIYIYFSDSNVKQYLCCVLNERNPALHSVIYLFDEIFFSSV